MHQAAGAEEERHAIDVDRPQAAPGGRMVGTVVERRLGHHLTTGQPLFRPGQLFWPSRFGLSVRAAIESRMNSPRIPRSPAAALAVCPARQAGRDPAHTRSRCQTPPLSAGPTAGVGGPLGCRSWGVSKEGRRAARPGSPLRRRASEPGRAQRDRGLMLVGSTEEAIPC